MQDAIRAPSPGGLLGEARGVLELPDCPSARGGPSQIVGWSLGGYVAREAARERPDAVSQVITLGSPVVGGPKYTAIARAYRRRGLLETRVTAVYSRSDGVVAWKACIDRHGKNVEHLEVETTHLGLGFSPDVYRIIAERLARTEEP